VSTELTPSTAAFPPHPSAPIIIPRAEHPISRKSLAREVLWVLGRLVAHGYKAYLVGGAVRDLYLGKEPKDYDIATDARPSRLKKIFRNCRIIGRRFRIAHVFFPSGLIVEVATFRQNSTKAVRAETGMILRDNEYGTPEEDARRRDLTINALFYDISTFSVIDFVGGVEDIRRCVVRMINEPETSFREDPVRMLRALRHAARTDFSVDADTLEAIYSNADEITQANPSRLLEEIFKDLRSGFALKTFQSYLEAGLLGAILPLIEDQIADHGERHPLWSNLEALDRRVRDGSLLSNAVLLTILLRTLLVPEDDSDAPWNGHLPPNPGAVITRGFQELPRTLRISRRDGERVAQVLIAQRKIARQVGRPRLPAAIAEKVYMRDALEYLRIELDGRGEPFGFVDAWLEQVLPADASQDAWEGAGVEPEAGNEADAEAAARARPNTAFWNRDDDEIVESARAGHESDAVDEEGVDGDPLPRPRRRGRRGRRRGRGGEGLADTP
jgi:poly(A) polymerase